MIYQATLTRILTAHFVAEFLFQTSSLSKNKREKKWKSSWLYIHALIYSTFVYIAFSLWSQAFWLIPAFFISHLLIDRYRVSAKDNALNFILDQAAHLLVLIAIWTSVAPGSVELINSLVLKIWNSSSTLLIILGYILVAWPFGYLVGYITEPLRKQLSEQEARGLEKAGFWIGCLERVFVYSFLLTGYIEAIALLVAAKSVFRFGEIKDLAKRKETEYILIGSLLSFGLAMVTGYTILSLIK